MFGVISMNVVNSLIPLFLFLKRVNITLEEYLNLKKVPYPLVLSNGQVVYAVDKTLFFSQRENHSISSENTKIICNNFTLSSNNNLFIDTRKLNWFNYSEGKSNYTGINYRCTDLEVDIFKDAYKKEYIFKTETSQDSNYIFHNYETGKEEHSLSSLEDLSTENYEFSSFDLVNENDLDFLNKFNDFSYSVVYDFDKQTFVFTKRTDFDTQKSEPAMTQNNQSTASSSTSRNKKTTSVVEANKVAIIAATKLEVGGLALDLITDQIAKGIPEGFRPFIVGNPLFKIAVANAVNLLIFQTNIDDPKLLILNDAMMTKSYSAMLESFDLTSLLSNVLTHIPAGKLKTLSENE